MIDIILYSKSLQEIKQISINEVQAALQSDDNLVWIDIFYDADINPPQEIVNLLENDLKIHPLNIEDCVISKQNPKIEEYDEYMFSIIYSLNNDSLNRLELKEIDFAVGRNFVLSYRHNHIEEIEIVKNAFKSKVNHIHKNSTKLFHSIIDHIIDGYLGLVENLDINIDKSGNKIFKEPNNSQAILDLNSIRELLSEIRSIVIAEETMFLNASKGFYNILDEEENIFFKDIYDHLNKVVDKIDKQNNTISNLFMTQMNLSTQKLNELIKFLTIISAILLPANVIAGIFGMNFKNMPPLEHPLGFYITISSMLTVGIVMGFYFIYKKWV